VADLRINIGATDNASPKVAKVASETERLAAAQGRMTASTTKATAASAASLTGLIGWGAALAAAVKVTQAATEAFLQDEKSMIRLKFATGALAESFAEYASELQSRTGADEDSTRAVQAMLYQYGVAPEVVNKATKALVDYAAVSGTDVKQAAEELIKGADGGRAAFRELGLVYDEAATKTEMVANITDALTKKVGGAAEADAGSLSHSLRVVKADFGELLEAFGGFVAKVESKIGVLQFASKVMREITSGTATPGLTAAAGYLLGDGDGAPTPDMTSGATYLPLTGPGGKLHVDRSKVSDDALTKKARDARDAARKKWIDDQAKLVKEAQKNAQEVARALGDGEEKQLELSDQYRAEQEEAQAEAYEQERAALEEALAERRRIEKDAAEQRRAAQEKEENEARERGAAIGGAFANALAAQLNRLASGGELSPEETLVDVFTGIASVALSAAGAGWAAPLVGAAGSFAKSQLAKKHGGGWIGAPRFHNGAWVGSDERPAILQTGERVLSRAEVSSMGGPRGVDNAARGAVNITVNTLDGSTARDYFTRAGGRALVNAVRTGRGSIAAFGGRG